MIKIHCVNHFVEFAIKEALAETEFSKVEDFYYSKTFLLKNSGKIISKIKSAANVLNIQHYQLPKLTGTRFVGHQRAAFKCLLDTWPAMKLAFENIITDSKTRQETITKVKGLAKKLNSLKGTLCSAPQVQPLDSEAIANIDDSINASMDDDLLGSYLASIHVMDGELYSSFFKANDRTRSNSDGERVSIAQENMTNLGDTVVHETIAKKQNALRSLKVIFEEHFSSFSDPIYQTMKWLDPKKPGRMMWLIVVTKQKKLASHFKDSLEKAKFDCHVVHKEWHQLKNFANHTIVAQMLTHSGNKYLFTDVMNSKMSV